MLDHLLAIALLLGVPARALWRSRATGRQVSPKTIRYAQTIGLVIGLLSVLALDWVINHRAVALLGIGMPISTAALTGLAAAVAVLTIMALTMPRRPAAQSAELDEAQRNMLPETPVERRLFVIFAVAVGFGWELLYRGFLLFYLLSIIGLIAAIIVSATAYGAAHGFKSWRQFAGSLAASFAFTIGYALTDNLWWLIVLHIGLPLIGLLAVRPHENERPA